MPLLDAGAEVPTDFTCVVNGNQSFSLKDHFQLAAPDYSSTDRCESFDYYIDIRGDDGLEIQN
jgi:hypothetical protein